MTWSSRWHCYRIVYILGRKFPSGFFYMMDLYRDSIYTSIVGTPWHFNCYCTIVLNVWVWLGERGSLFSVTDNPSFLYSPRCDKHFFIMCETLTGSPVNTGEQPPPETTPSVTKINSESQPPLEVVPQVSSPTEDQVQSPLEQAAPPSVTTTDGCPALPSSGDSTHPTAT